MKMISLFTLFILNQNIVVAQDRSLPRDLPEFNEKKKSFESEKVAASIKNKEKYKKEWKQMLDVEKKFLASKYKLNCNTSFDCMAVSVGEKKCGGPSGFVIMSNLDPNLSSNQELITDYTNRISALKNQIKGDLGSCDAVIATQVVCLDGSCIQK